MGTYIIHTENEQRDMLHAIGKKDFDDLFSSVPVSVRIDALQLPKGMSEMEVMSAMEEMASENHVYRHILRGAGAYDHYIPSIVKSVTSKEEFLTAYTPYQAEISQGILQSIFEFQTMIAGLTGMDAANASVYDGATAAAEACGMCIEKKRDTILVSATTNPMVQSVIHTYAFGKDYRVIQIPEKDGVTDLTELKKLTDETTAAVYVQYPNFYGIIEDIEAIVSLTHDAGAKLIMGCYPVALGVLKTPGEYGADIAVGEGQSLGLPLSFGGPYLGFMATTSKLMRKLPGRIIGRTTDTEGRDAYVLTLQAREQHIRREKASSNICSNEALCALTAAVYLSAMGPGGMQTLALHCAENAHKLAEALHASGLLRKHTGTFFNEFVTTSDAPADIILGALAQKDILGGLPLNEKEILWCATEKCTDSVIAQTADTVKEVLG